MGMRADLPTMIVVTCGSCGSKLRTRAPDEVKMARCPKCSSRLRIEPPAVSMSDADALEPVEEAPAPQPAPAPTPAPLPAVAPPPPPEPQSVARTEWISASKAEWESEPDLNDDEPSEQSDKPDQPESSEAVRPHRRRENWLKSLILLMGASVIAAFAWYALVRFGGEGEWII